MIGRSDELTLVHGAHEKKTMAEIDAIERKRLLSWCNDESKVQQVVASFVRIFQLKPTSAWFQALQMDALKCAIQSGCLAMIEGIRPIYISDGDYCQLIAIIPSVQVGMKLVQKFESKFPSSLVIHILPNNTDNEFVIALQIQILRTNTQFDSSSIAKLASKVVRFGSLPHIDDLLALHPFDYLRIKGDDAAAVELDRCAKLCHRMLDVAAILPTSEVFDHLVQRFDVPGIHRRITFMGLMVTPSTNPKVFVHHSRFFSVIMQMFYNEDQSREFMIEALTALKVIDLKKSSPQRSAPEPKQLINVIRELVLPNSLPWLVKLGQDHERMMNTLLAKLPKDLVILILS